QIKAAELGLPFRQELSLYLIHGWLHLAGYDDRNDEDRAAMRTAEGIALEIAKDVIDSFRLSCDAGSRN
ncbi:MAG: rRNA maturation RNase YbeY, partial [Coraliomargarita sp.]|nr:rRNA maturation RNase YbeY [Coraliomargarita sp.]